MTDFVTVSELGKVDPYFALLGSIRARKEALRREWAYCSQATKRCDAKPFFVQKCVAALAHLGQMEGRLDIPYPITTTLPHENILRAQLGDPADRPVDAKRDGTQVDNFLDVRKQFRSLGTSTQQKQDIFGMERGKRYSKPVDWFLVVMDMMKAKGAAGRLAEHRWRLIEEIEHRAASGWYIVFNTLTVDNENYSAVFAKGSTAWRYYVNEVGRAIATEIYGSVAKSKEDAKTNPYHSYFAVVERGGKRGRLHIHVIHCMREIPSAWKKDPNRANGPPVRRQINSMKKFWRFGHSMPIACRFGDFDAFGRLGWCWPVVRDGKKFKPVPWKPSIAIARYMCKYILKAYSKKPADGEFLWRTRISSGFGLGRMRQCIETMSDETLWMYLQEIPRPIVCQERRLPTNRVRLECLRNLLKRTRNVLPGSGESSLKLLTIRKSLSRVTPQPRIGERLRALTRPMTISSSVSSTISDPQLLKETGGFNVQRAFSRAFARPVTRFAARGGTPRH